MFCQQCGAELSADTMACACGAAVTETGPKILAAEVAKAASKDSILAFKLFASNPVPGLPAAFASLGGARALHVGITFGVVSSLCVLVGAYRLLSNWGAPHGVGGFLKALICALVPFVSLAAAGALVRAVAHGKGGLAADAFIAGASLLPFGIAVLAGSLLGLGNLEFIGVLFLFAICLAILMLFAGYTQIAGLSERAATACLPLALIGSGWLSKIMFAAIM
jgi:hypothetical protein